jgi:hypothetical protein
MTELQTQRSYPVTLPIGHADAAGTWHRRGAIRKLRGTDEELFYDTGLNGAELVTQLIHRSLVRLEGIERLEKKLIEQLYCADRNYLLLELRRVTFGDVLRAHYICPACQHDVQRIESLEQLPVRRLADNEQLEPVTVMLDDGFEDRRGTVHREVVVAPPRGTDEAFVAGLAERDLLQARDALLLRCIRKFGSLPRAELEAYGVKILRELTLGDRRKLHDALNAAPGVDFLRSVTCPDCGAAFEAVMDVSDFFVVN